MADLNLNALARSFYQALQVVGEHHLRQLTLGVRVPGGVLLIKIEVFELNSLQSQEKCVPWPRGIAELLEKSGSFFIAAPLKLSLAAIK